MQQPIDHYYLTKDEPVKSCLLALKEIILKQNANISAEWKYGMPFFCYNGKMFCYLWVNKKLNWPYIGIVEGNKIEHPDLIMEKRSRMKILLVDPDKDIPIKKIEALLKCVIHLYISGLIPLNK